MPATGTPSESGFKRYFCPHCGYDVSATPRGKPCPECGSHPFSREAHLVDVLNDHEMGLFIRSIRRLRMHHAIILVIYVFIAMNPHLPWSARPYVAVTVIGALIAIAALNFRDVRVFAGAVRGRNDDTVDACVVTVLVCRVMAIVLLVVAVASHNYSFELRGLEFLSLMAFLALEYFAAAAVLTATVSFTERIHANRLVATSASLALVAWPGALTVLLPPLGVGVLVLMHCLIRTLLRRSLIHLDEDIKRTRAHTSPNS